MSGVKKFAPQKQNTTGWRERERDNVVYWKTKRKIKNDLQYRLDSSNEEFEFPMSENSLVKTNWELWTKN